jgi:proteasome accessory factor B
MALYFARGLMKPLVGTPFYEALDSAMAKIGAGISAPGHSLLSRIEGHSGVLAFGTKDYSRSREVIAALSRAVQHHFTVRLHHATLQHTTAMGYVVDPYRLQYVQGGLYLVGLDHGKQELRTFAVERIREVKLTRKRFDPLPAARLEELQASAFQLIQGEPKLVRVWFSAAQAPYVRERMWHPSQEIAEQADGSVILSLRVASLWEVERWVYGWGGDAKVLS